jgi:hypothetical protein
MGAANSANSAIRVVVFAVCSESVCACTTLGPTPAMTGMPTPPLERPGVELQVGAVPGYHLSSAVTEEPKADVMPQLAGVFEPDQLIHVPGLLAGARYAGDADAGAALEPLLGYRTFLDAGKRFSLATLGFLAYASGADNGASFTAWRGGLEVGFDARVTPPSKFAELHGNVGATFTGLNADGEYCLGLASPFGVDCPSEPSERRLVSASASGIFPSAHAGVSLDFGRHLHAPFHGVRLALELAGGTLPTLREGVQHGARLFGSGGLSLTLGLGANSGSGVR